MVASPCAGMLRTLKACKMLSKHQQLGFENNPGHFIASVLTVVKTFASHVLNITLGITGIAEVMEAVQRYVLAIVWIVSRKKRILWDAHS